MSMELSEQEVLRRKSLAALRELGIEPYPAEMFDVTATAAEISENLTEENKEKYASVRIAGRIMSRRIMGSASFFELQDHTGRIQVYIRRDDICPEGDPTLYNTVFTKSPMSSNFLKTGLYNVGSPSGQMSSRRIYT